MSYVKTILYLICVVLFADPISMQNTTSCFCVGQCTAIEAAKTALTVSATILNGAITAFEQSLSYAQAQIAASGDPAAIAAAQQAITAARLALIPYRAEALALRAKAIALGVECNADPCCRGCCSTLYSDAALNSIFDPNKPLPSYESPALVKATPIGCGASIVTPTSNSTTNGTKDFLW